MIEAEWLGCGNPSQMLYFLGKTGRGTDDAPQHRPVPTGQLPLDAEARRRYLADYAEALRMATRKGVLFSCACVWRVRDRLPGIDLAALARSWEAIADAPHEGDEATSPRDEGAPPRAPAAPGLPARPQEVHGVSEWAARVVVSTAPVLEGGVWINERRAQAALLHCLFGNPFRPVTLDPSWLKWNDGTVRRIAEGIYEQRAFGRLPILHDALLDAGCDNEQLLAHLRAPGPHVRGCWALDLLLGKQ
jgi:hypothetical protein